MNRIDILNEKIHKSLSDYIGFDINELLKQGDPLIFGGAIRDSICGDPIKDIDVIVGSMTYNKIYEFLTTEGFEYSVNEYFLNDLYYDMELIFTPINFEKDDVIIQLIKPRLNRKIIGEEMFKEGFRGFAGEVDLSCCGVAYDISNKVIETYGGAIPDCMRKEFKVLKDNKMHQPHRIEERIKKLEDRKWIRYDY